ncbi:hypothetical protein DL89DRAFT_60426 [Linderina pennispora]|uniref:Uncharacterized protein n=1 Tax=Linderina pennispora TaxID=61395 RepID=A0A1Y1W116_9FUNG|nr:uncharacterized protein DL89DRAFT_60426 [Linderina pennispora]ORX66814.1 hypothetical protein DL89DRAFT_60426 [Linderina pennispora]
MAKTKKQLRVQEMTQQAESQGRGSPSSTPRSASSRSTNGDESSAKAALAPVSVQHSTFNTAASSVGDASRASSEPDDVYPYVLIIRPPSSARSRAEAACERDHPSGDSSSRSKGRNCIWACYIRIRR